MPDIDELNIKITASAKSASDSIDRLIRSLGDLKAKLDGIGTSNLTELANNLGTISNAASGMSSAANNIKTLAAALKEMRGIRLEALSKSLDTLSSSVTNVNTDAISKLERLAEVGTKLSSVATDVSQLGTAMKTLSGSQIKAVADGVEKLTASVMNVKPETAESFARLTASLEQLSGTASGLGQFATAIRGLGSTNVRNLAEGLQTLVNSIQWLSTENVDTLDRVASSMERLANAARNMPGGTRSLSRLMHEMMDREREPGGTPTPTGEEMRDADEGTARLGTEAENASSRISFLSVALSGLKSALSTVGGLLRHVASGLGKIYIGAAKAFAWPVSKAVSGVKSLVGKIGQLGAAFKRIAFYRAIRSIIKAITQSVKEGVNNLYEYSKLTGGEFAQAMNRASTATHYFKNSLGAMLGPIITALVPVLDFAIDKIVEFMNAVNQLIAKLSGADSWNRAVRYPREYGEEANNAAKKVKKLKDYMLGIDELNVFNPDSGSGGSGGGSAVDASELFENVDVFDNEIADFAERIKEAIANGDWEGVGKILGEKVNDLTSQLENSKLGEKIGSFISNAIKLASGFFNEVDFKALGSALGTQLNNLIGQIEPGSIGRLIGTVLSKAAALAGGFFSKTDFETLGKMIGADVTAAFNVIGESDIGKDLASIINAAVNLASGFFSETDFSAFGGAIATQIAQFVGEINWKDLGSDLVNAATGIADFLGGLIKDPSNFAILGTAVSDLFSGALTSLTDWFKKTDGKQLAIDIGNAIGEFLDGIDWSGLANGVFVLIKEAFEFIVEFIAGIFQPVVDFVNDLLGRGGRKIGESDTPTFNEYVDNMNRLYEKMGEENPNDTQAMVDMYNRLYGGNVHMHSSGAVFGGIGGKFGQEFADSFSGPFAAIFSLTGSVRSKFLTFIKKLKADSKTSGKESGTEFSNGFSAGTSGGAGAASGMGKHFYNAMTNMRIRAKATGKDSGTDFGKEFRTPIESEFGGRGGIFRIFSSTMSSMKAQAGSTGKDSGTNFGKEFKTPIETEFGQRGSIFSTFSNAMTRLSGSAKTGSDAAVKAWTTDAKSDLERAYDPTKGTVTGVVSRGLSSFGTAASGAFSTMSSKLSDFGKDVKAMMEGDNSTMAMYGKSGSANLTNPFLSLPKWFKENVTNKIGNIFKTDDEDGSFSNAAENAVSGVKTKFSSLPEWVTKTFRPSLTSAFSKLFGNGSSGSDSGTVVATSEDGLSGMKGILGKFPTWVSDTLKPKTQTVFDKLFGGSKPGGEPGSIVNKSNDAIADIEKNWKPIPKWFEENVSKKIGKQLDDTFKRRYVIGTTQVNGQVSGWNINRVDTKANGGFLSSGQLFLARENGINEMIGSIGNRNAVANNYQIEEGIARATERANERTIIALYTIAGQLVRAIEENATDFVIGDDVIGQASQRYQQKSGINSSKGAFANAY